MPVPPWLCVVANHFCQPGLLPLTDYLIGVTWSPLKTRQAGLSVTDYQVIAPSTPPKYLQKPSADWFFDRRNYREIVAAIPSEQYRPIHIVSRFDDAHCSRLRVFMAGQL